jgi:ribosomal protein S18 acetylase RimI-like enzyme
MSVLAAGYHKRYKMEVALAGLPRPRWPAGFTPRRWHADLLTPHGEVLAACFEGSPDALIFPSLGSVAGAVGLMAEIARRRAFLPEATWLLEGPEGPCGTIQAMCERPGLGGIQNVGILERWRGKGLGRALLLQSLHGMYDAGMGRAVLEVTASNATAIRLYAALGFRRSRVVYKTVPLLTPGEE